MTNGKNPAEMMPEEFLAVRGRIGTGLANWLRSLPAGVPSAMPEEVMPRFGSRGGKQTPSATSALLNAATRRAGFRVAVRTFDGAPWVMRLADQPKEEEQR